MPAPTPDHHGDPALVARLTAAGCIGAGARQRALRGGVSSDVILFEDEDGRQVVVKRALARLRVADEWHADTGRNAYEQAWLSLAATLAPANIPRIVFAAPEEGWFAMEYLGEGWITWKQSLLIGAAEPLYALEAGAALGRIHRATWSDHSVATTFDTLRNFTELRIDPYFNTSAKRLPDLAPWLQRISEQLASQRLALVHGDFSPKNLMIQSGQLIILDAEVAWFGDPAFDVAFLIHHLLLKALHHRRHDRVGDLLALTPTFWRSYADQLPDTEARTMENRVIEITLALLLARVHGKSPVDYLDEAGRHTVTSFVRTHAPSPPGSIPDLAKWWGDGLS
jgi:aminoglycoside phosphotransferase (APT) family kinase protein